MHGEVYRICFTWFVDCLETETKYSGVQKKIRAEAAEIIASNEIPIPLALLGDVMINNAVHEFAEDMTMAGHTVYLYSFEYNNEGNVGIFKYFYPFSGEHISGEEIRQWLLLRFSSGSFKRLCLRPLADLMERWLPNKNRTSPLHSNPSVIHYSHWDTGIGICKGDQMPNATHQVISRNGQVGEALIKEGTGFKHIQPYFFSSRYA
uniref:Uncharacterized protein n=1 Tax=Parascaris equorum TaxID=6256 RepID=A0A914R250_PAREQ